MDAKGCGVMRIFLLELKKIWTPGSIIMLVGAAALYYWLYGYGPVQNFPNGTEAALNLELALEWRERFGSAIDVDELAQIDADFDAARAEFARDVSEIPEAVEGGVVSWETHLAFSERLRSEMERQAERGVTRVEPGSELDRLGGLSSEIISLPSYRRLSELDLWQTSLTKEMDGTTEQGYLHLSWLQNIEAYGRFLSTWLVIAPAFVVAPFVMRDRLYRMRAAQWTCRAGRGIFVPQFTAAMLSACVVLVVSVVFWALPFAATEVPGLLDCALVGPWSGYDCPWDMTLGSYIALRIALMLAVGLTSALVSHILARASAGYVGMLLRLVPWCAGAGFIVVPELLDYALCAKQVGAGLGAVFGRVGLPGFETAVVATGLVLAAVLCCGAFRRQMRCDLKTR